MSKQINIMASFAQVFPDMSIWNESSHHQFPPFLADHPRQADCRATDEHTAGGPNVRARVEVD
jgi:hypothetical protein